jgi:hypothetical protein
MAWVIAALCVVFALPCLVFRYTPMTDLPQHEAIVSIMRHMHDPSFGFDRYYEWALNRTLYIFPYLLSTGLAYIVPIGVAMQITVFLATVSYPLGVMMTLRALRKPLVLTLLALPLVYNRAFFWGFLHFNFGIGLAFFTLSQLVGTWSRAAKWSVAGLSLLTAVSHVYGLALLFAYVAAWLLAGQRRQLLSRVPWILPAALGSGAWGVFAANAPGYGEIEWAPWNYRLKELGHSILGGYVDNSENVILFGLTVLIIALTYRSFPLTGRRWISLGTHSRVGYILVALNLVAYFVLPVATPAAKFIHFRHAVLAAMMLPLIVSDSNYRSRSVVAGILPAIVAAMALGNAWWHLWRFDREARAFDSILAVIPARSHLAQLTYESKGGVMRTHAYLHFGAYAQAQKGGAFAVSFPLMFWNIPLRRRPNSSMPQTPRDMEWSPARFNEYSMGHFYDTILIREGSGRSFRSPLRGPYELAATSGPWKLYRRIHFQKP